MPKKVWTPISSLCAADSITGTHRGRRRTSGIKVGDVAHVSLSSLCAIVGCGEVGCVVATAEGDSTDVNIPTALASPLPYCRILSKLPRFRFSHLILLTVSSVTEPQLIHLPISISFQIVGIVNAKTVLFRVLESQASVPIHA